MKGQSQYWELGIDRSKNDWQEYDKLTVRLHSAYVSKHFKLIDQQETMESIAIKDCTEFNRAIAVQTS